MFSQKVNDTPPVLRQQIQAADGSPAMRHTLISPPQLQNGIVATASDLESNKTYQNALSMFAYGRQFPDEMESAGNLPTNNAAHRNVQQFRGFVNPELSLPKQGEASNTPSTLSVPTLVTSGTVHRDSSAWILTKHTIDSLDMHQSDEPPPGHNIPGKKGTESDQGRNQSVRISSPTEYSNDKRVNTPDEYAFLFGKPMKDLSVLETHTAQLLPIPQLWNTETSQPGPHFTTFEDLLEFLREDTRHTFYVGQDRADFINILEKSFTRPKHIGFVRENLKPLSLNQRVPIFNPRNHRLDPPNLWPLVRDYREFVQREHSLALEERQSNKSYRLSGRRRLFTAAKTSTLGFGPPRADKLRSKWSKQRLSQKRRTGFMDTDQDPANRRVRRKTGSFSLSDKVTSSSIVISRNEVESSNMHNTGSQRPKRKVRRSVLYPASAFAGIGFDSIARNYQSDNDETPPCAPREDSLGIDRVIPPSAHSRPDSEVMGSDLKDFLQNDPADGDVEVPEHMATSKFIDYILDWSVRTPSSTSIDIKGDMYTNHEVNHSMGNTGSRDEDKDNFSDRTLFGHVGSEAFQRLREGVSLESPVSPVKQNLETVTQIMPVTHSSEEHGCSLTTGEKNDMNDASYYQPLHVGRHVEHLDDRPTAERGNSPYPQIAYETRSLPAGTHPFAPPSGKKQLHSTSHDSDKNTDIHPGSGSHYPMVPEDISESFKSRQVHGALKGQGNPNKPTQTDVVTTTHIRSSLPSLESAPVINETGYRPSQHHPSKVVDLRTNEEHASDILRVRCTDHDSVHVRTSATENASTTHLQSAYRALDVQSNLTSSVGVAFLPCKEVGTNSKPHSITHFDDHSKGEVYLWDHQKNARSEQTMSIQDAVLHCLRSNHLAIYDGQDFDFAHDKMLALTGLSEKDRTAWDGRRSLQRKSRKVRVWDFRMGCLRTHFRSPAVQRLHSWLQSNPNCTVFAPWLLIPNGVKEREREPKPILCEADEKQSSSLFKYIGRRLKHLVVQRIRYLRVLDISNGQLSKTEIWNAFSKRKESPRSFKSRRELLKFLFQNPWLELVYGQDQVFELETTTCKKLVGVSLNSPVSIGRFWDTVENQIYDSCDEIDGFSSIGNLLAQKPRYVLYQGQDLACSQSLSKYASSLVPFRFLVMHECGPSVQEAFFSKRWVTIVVDPNRHCTSCAVFWNKHSKSVHMQPDCNKKIPISLYLEEHQRMELYMGQNQPEETRRELQDWFELKQRCKPIEDDRIVLLTRAEFVPSRYSPVVFPELTDETELKAKRLGSTDRVPSTQNEKNKMHRKTNHVEVQGGKNCIDIPASEDPSQVIGVRSLVNKHVHAPPQKYSENDTVEQLQRQCGQDSLVTRPAEVVVLEPSLCTSIGSDVNSEANSLSPELEEVSQSFEERLRAPARIAARMLTLVKEVGPRILKQELVHDLRQALYENFIMEVGSRAELLDLFHDISDLQFVRMAAELCNELESLDVTGCFSAVEDVGYGASDVLAVRDDLESGKICTMNDVVRKFRVICQNLIHFNEGFYFEQEALDLKKKAEEVIHRYMTRRGKVFEAEARLSRLTRICERARQIGFRKPQSPPYFISEATSPARVHESSKSTTRDRARVTFLNYRDEKGNSVMGKRHSVRVFGLPIHRQECQRELGGVRPCHVCGCDVFEAEENSLLCSNRFYGGCNECLCKKCLESVTCMESVEFIAFRDSQNWICIHCRGLCPAGSSCLEKRSEEGAVVNHMESILFSWPYDLVEVPLSMTVSLLRREDNGEFDERSEHGSTFSLAQSEGVWSATLKCRIGAYRAFVKANGEWIASTTFYVRSLRRTKKLQSEVKTKKSVVLKYYSSKVRPKKAIVPRGPRVLWKVAEEDRPGSVHAIPRNDSQGENRVITECSRTEGYDWQRAKRHHVLHWRPCPKKADHSTDGLSDPNALGGNGESSNMSTLSNVQLIMLSPSDKNHAIRPGLGRSPPKSRPGLSHKEFITEWNTFKYDEMLKSLWGIITGRSEIHGIGLFTLTGYHKGDFIIEYAGDLIRTPLADIREARYVAAGLGTYLFKINEQQIVDATVHSNRARFTNHSCDPNMIANIIHVRGRDLVVLQATRDIPKLAELTFDYKLPYEDTKVQCLCNAWNCVGVMN